MANTTFQLRRSSVAGKVPNTSTLSIGELGLNITDQILYSSNGSGIFEIGANLTNLTVGGIQANGSYGISGQVLTSNGYSTFWSTPSGAAAGTNTTIQFNDSGFSNGSVEFTFDKSSNTVSIGNSTVNSTINSTSFSTGNTSITSSILSIGNSTVNTAITSTGITQNGLNFKVPKNYIVNPGMRISQENGTSSSTSSGYYPVDQWFSAHSQDGTLTFQQVASATPGGSQNRIRMTVTSADTSIAAGQFAAFLQYIEGLRTADLQWGTVNATDVVLRFGFKGPAGTYAVAIRNQDGNRSFIREFTISGGDANTDTLQTVTFPGDTSGTWDKDNTSSLNIVFTFATGSTFQTTADSWQAGNYFGTSSTSNGIGTASDVFELFDVGLYADPDSTGLAPRFELPHYDADLAECQRYYHKGFVSIRAYAAGAGYVYENRAYFPNSMRVAPIMAGPTGGLVSGNISSNVFLDPEIDSVQNQMVTSGAGDAYCTQRSYIANARM